MSELGQRQWESRETLSARNRELTGLGKMWEIRRRQGKNQMSQDSSLTNAVLGMQSSNSQQEIQNWPMREPSKIVLDSGVIFLEVIGEAIKIGKRQREKKFEDRNLNNMDNWQIGRKGRKGRMEGGKEDQRIRRETREIQCYRSKGRKGCFFSYFF